MKYYEEYFDKFIGKAVEVRFNDRDADFVVGILTEHYYDEEDERAKVVLYSGNDRVVLGVPEIEMMHTVR